MNSALSSLLSPSTQLAFLPPSCCAYHSTSLECSPSCACLKHNGPSRPPQTSSLLKSFPDQLKTALRRSPVLCVKITESSHLHPIPSGRWFVICHYALFHQCAGAFYTYTYISKHLFSKVCFFHILDYLCPTTATHLSTIRSLCSPLVVWTVGLVLNMWVQTLKSPVRANFPKERAWSWWQS